MSKPLEVNCPNCQASVAWKESNPHRPFCSARCKNSDFIDWANEQRTIPGNRQYADVFSEEPGDAEQ